MTGRAYASILRFKVDCLDHRRNIGALLGDRACKFLWAADVEDLAGRFEPVADAAVRGDVTHVGGYLFLELLRHRLDPKQPRHALNFEGRVALLTSGRDLGGRLHAVLVGHGNELYAVGAPLRLHDGKRRHHDLNAAFTQVNRGQIDVAVWYLGDLQLFVVLIAPERELGDAL